MTPVGGAYARTRGLYFQRKIADYLRDAGALFADSAAGGREQPLGDITGVPGVVIECKSASRLDLAAWSDRTSALAAALPGEPRPTWAVVAKRPGVADVARSYVLTDLETYVELLTAAGWINP